MKKFLAKLVLFVIISILMNLSLAGAYAATDPRTGKTIPEEAGTTSGETADQAIQDLHNDEERSSALGDLAALTTGDNACFDETEENTYIITIVEEPLLWEESQSPDADYITKICYRNTLDLTHINGGVISEISKYCSDGLLTKFPKNYFCEEIMVIFSKGGTSLIEGYISTIYKWAASVVGIIAVIVIIISGIQIAASGGDSQPIEEAKNRIIKSLSGLAVLFLSGLILYTINPTFFTK